MTARKTISLAHLDPDGMKALARALRNTFDCGDIVSLEGDLGTGKTFLVRELARAFGYTQHVTSPTFVLQKLYELPPNERGIDLLVHYDVYRLESYDELWGIGFEELPSSAVTLVEWGNRFADFFPPTCWRISLTFVDETRRNVTIQGPAERIARLCAALEREGLAPLEGERL
jgi:tRNA threonylcarbamoyl adenosine modification protein YjeE